MKEGETLIFSTANRNPGKDDRVPVWKKLAYAIGSMPYAMCTTVTGFYFSIFLLEVVILDPTYVLIIIFSGRVWDAITDPVVGYLTSHTRTRFGRLRPWLGASMVPVGIVYFFLWYVPPLDGQPGYVRYFYYQIIYLLFQASLTCIHVPYTALTMHMSNDSKERDSVTLYRMCFEVSGTVIGIFVYTAYYLGFAESVTDCNDVDRKPNESLRAAYRWHGLTVSFLIVIFVSVTFLVVREQADEASKDKRIGFFKGLKETWGFKPYFYLLMLELFSWLALQFIQGNLALYIKYSVGLESQYPYLIAVLLVSTIVFMPLWQVVILKFGKKTSFYVGMWTFLPLILCMLFVDYVPMASYGLNFLGGMGISCAYLLPWSMLPDVIDEATLRSDVRREELFYAFFVFGNKFGSGVTLGISTAVYKLAGYDEKVCEQPWTVPLTLKLLVSIPPVIFILISFIFLHFYPITEKTRKRTKMLLSMRRRTKLSGESNDSDSDLTGSSSVSTIARTNQDISFHGNFPGAKGLTASRQTDL